jgi:hypothetical protein
MEQEFVKISSEKKWKQRPAQQEFSDKWLVQEQKDCSTTGTSSYLITATTSTS